jgi:UDP-N-acetylmuramate--alanine ligase
MMRPMNAAAPRTFHLIGIGGIGVSGVAFALLARGQRVTGSDVRESQLTLALRAAGATVHIGHDAAHLVGADVVVVSTAIPETNPELVAARAQGLDVRHRSEVLGALLADYPTAIGVIGTHGKGTTSAAITWLLERGGQAPSFIIGGLLENFGKINARVTPPGPDAVIVAEVDESDGSLVNVHPTIAVVNNLEADHLNYYTDLAHIQRTVAAALNANPRLERVFLNADCPGAMGLAASLKAPVTTFGTQNNPADVKATEVFADFHGGRFVLSREPGATASDVRTARPPSEGDAPGRQSAEAGATASAASNNRASVGAFRTVVPGLHNLDNCVAAAAVGLHLGVRASALDAAFSTFRGLENRFSIIERAGRTVIKDYISHPTGIRRVLQAAKTSGRKTTAVFKPYRFTMVNYLQDDYAEAFHDADHTIITELYPAGEVPIPGIDTAFLCDKIRARGPRVTHVPAMDDIPALLNEIIGEGELVVFFGGDDLFRLADAFAESLVDGGAA